MRAASLFGLAGLALATALFLWEGLGPVLAAMGTAGLGILWASLCHFLPMTINARAWQILLPAPRRAGLGFFLWAVWLREAVNGLLPVARIGGEVVTARLLMRHGLRPAHAVASLVVDVTVSLVSQFAFTLLGLVLLATRHGEGAGVAELAAGLAVAVPVVGALAFAQRLGLFGVLARGFRALFGDRFDGLVGGAAPLDRAVRRFYRRRAAVLRCGLWQLAGWIAGAGEVWLALRFLGWPAGVADALVIEAVIQAVSSGAFLVPAALGVQEGGFLMIGRLVGLPADIALALALMRRARDILVFAPALLAWQVTLGRCLLLRA